MGSEGNGGTVVAAVESDGTVALGDSFATGSPAPGEPLPDPSTAGWVVSRSITVDCGGTNEPGLVDPESTVAPSGSRSTPGRSAPLHASTNVETPMCTDGVHGNR